MRQIRWIFPRKPACNPAHKEGDDLCDGTLVYCSGAQGRLRYARCNKCHRTARIIALGRELENDNGERYLG